MQGSDSMDITCWEIIWSAERSFGSVLSRQLRICEPSPMQSDTAEAKKNTSHSRSSFTRSTLSLLGKKRFRETVVLVQRGVHLVTIVGEVELFPHLPSPLFGRTTILEQQYESAFQHLRIKHVYEVCWYHCYIGKLFVALVNLLKSSYKRFGQLEANSMVT
jgi:hypothetical protein